MAANFLYEKRKIWRVYIILVNCSYFYIIKLFRVRKKEYQKNTKFL